MTILALELSGSSDIPYQMLSYAIDEDRLTICRAAGHIEFLPAAQTIERILEAPQMEEIRGVLFVIEDMDAFLSLSVLKSLLPLVRHWGKRFSGQGWAVVAPNHMSHALAKLTLPTLQLGPSAVECFASETEAMNWLQTEAAKV